MDKIQDRKLKKLLIHCYETVAYYKREFDECGFNPYHFRRNHLGIRIGDWCGEFGSKPVVSHRQKKPPYWSQAAVCLRSMEAAS